MSKVKEFALYKGDKLLAMGTKGEIAKQLGISVHAVHSYGSPSYHKRTSEENGRRLYEI